MMILVSASVVGTIVLGFALGYDDVDLWGGIIVPTIICSGTIPLILRVERRRRSGLGSIIGLALVAKMVGSYLRFLLSYYVYDGNDSALYHANGVAIAESYLRGDRTLGSLIPTSFGTQFIDELNGIVALISGRSLLASFMVFSWFGFLGLWAIVAAVRRCLPDVDIRRYTVLVLFLPSSLFWPSSLGKEAWMLLGIGLFATGASRIYTAQARGLLYMFAGVVATGMVRPHVTAILLTAFTIALVVARQRTGRALRPVLTIMTIGFVAAAAAFASGPLEEILPNQERGLTAVLDATSERTGQGGSEIEVQRANSPQDYPLAFVTVLFRPLIFEVGTFTQFLSSLESSFLLLAAVTGRRRITNGLSQVLRNPFAQFAVLYTMAFAFAWSSFGNLGIISRQRVQVMPFLLILLCWNARDRRRSPDTMRAPLRVPRFEVMS